MSASAQAPRRDIATLAEMLRSVTDRAADTQKAQNLAADYGALRDRVSDAADAMERQVTLLASPMLSPHADDRAAIEERCDVLRAIVANVRATVATNPDAVRRGSLWRQAEAAMTAVQKTADETIENAFRRLAGELPSPEPGLLAAVPQGTAGRDQYRAAEARYHEEAQPPRTLDDLERFITLTRKLGELKEQLLTQAVPSEFRGQWRQLQSGQLSLTDLQDDFRAWLEERGMLGDVVLSYRPG